MIARDIMLVSMVLKADNYKGKKKEDWFFYFLLFFVNSNKIVKFLLHVDNYLL